MSAPQSLGDGPVPANPTNIGAALPEGVGRYGNVIRGTGASNGRATGIARVVQVGGAMPRVHPGDILVAVNVGPDWTPAFGIIGGLVLDQGALFQHAALVAREYRIPAVLQTRDATSAIRDGQTITVDGNAGTVELES